MSDPLRPAVPPLELIGDDAPVCIDGVCAVTVPVPEPAPDDRD